MDASAFDRLVKYLATAGSRRGLLGLLPAVPALGGLAALLTGESDAKDRRQRRKDGHNDKQKRRGKHRDRVRKRNQNKTKRQQDQRRRKRQRCTPDSTAQTCAGRCASVTNNCGVNVACGPCDCGACAVCLTCNPATGACIPDATLENQPCGTPGQVCQPGTGVCACDAASCDPGQRCDGTSCICDDISCGAGCCAGTTCHINEDTACGTTGGVCTNCVALGQVCGGGGTPGVCGCESAAEACGSQTCGTAVDNCGQTVPCGSCATCQICSGGQCQGDPTDCSSGCCSGTTCLPGNTATHCGHVGEVCFDCGETQACVGDICECRPTGISCCVSAGNVPVGVVTNCSICCSGACNTPGVPSSGCAS